jgi:catechol 2,3-dioxygenase-like lactoylglutathione lyase family enzyme
MTLQIDHIQLAIPEGGEDQARAFWSGLLGLVELPKPDALAARGGCWFSLGTQELHLGVETPFSPARKAHPGLLTPRIDALADALAPVTWDSAIPERRRFFASDPFGNRLEFIESS